MLLSWAEIFSLALITLNVPHLVAGLSMASFKGDADNLFGTIEKGIKNDFGDFENKVESDLVSDLADDLASRGGILGQFTMGQDK